MTPMEVALPERPAMCACNHRWLSRRPTHIKTPALQVNGENGTESGGEKPMTYEEESVVASNGERGAEVRQDGGLTYAEEGKTVPLTPLKDAKTSTA